MKRFLAIFSIFVLIFGLAACKEKPPKADPAQAKIDEVYETLDALIAYPDNITADITLPASFINGVTGTWKSDGPSVLSIGQPEEGQVKAKVNRPANGEGNAKVILSIELSIPSELNEGKLTKTWSIELTIIELDPLDDEFYTSFEDAYQDVVDKKLGLTNFRTKLLSFEGVSFYGKTTGGYFLVSQDGSLAYIHGTTNMPKAGDIFNITAKVYNYFGFFQLDDVNYTDSDETLDYTVNYVEKTIEDIVNLPLLGSPHPDNMTGPSTFKLKNVKLVLHPTETNNQYNLMIVPKDFDLATAEKNTDGIYYKDSIMVYYTTTDYAEIKTLVDLEIAELNVIYEGYRDDKFVKYVTILNVDDITLAGEMTDEIKVGMAKGVLEIETNFPKAGTLELPKTGVQNTTISWDFKVAEDVNNALINLTTGEVTTPTDGRVTVKLVATIKSGTFTDTKEFEVFVGAFTVKDIIDVFDLAEGQYIMVKGVVTDKYGNNVYGLQDNTGSIPVNFSGALELGKAYVLIGEKNTYSSGEFVQLRNIEVVTSESSLFPSALAIDGILGDLNELEKIIGKWISIEGAEVVNVGAPDKNGNIEIKIKKGEVELTVRYDSRVQGADVDALNLTVGDIVNYVGVLSWFKGPQLGYGPNTYIGKGWPQEAFEFVTTIDFGTVAVTGYGKAEDDFIQEKAFINGDGQASTVVVKRGQINAWKADPEKPSYHDLKGAFVVLAPINTATESYLELDFASLLGMTEIKFTFAAWSAAAYAKAAAFTDAKVALQVWDGTAWVTLNDSLDRENVISSLKDGEYVTVTYAVEGPGKYRVLYDAPTAASGNTTQALTFDDIIISGEKVVPPVVIDDKGLIIYEVYGGGGNADAPYTNDYVVLYNGSDFDIDLSEYSLHYASAAGQFGGQTESTTYDKNALLEGIIKVGEYFVIKLGAGSTVTDKELPIVDFAAGQFGGMNLAAANGKVALVRSTDIVGGITGKDDPRVVDFVGFGTANAYEGSAAAPAPSNTKSIRRTSLVDTNDNAADFAVVDASLAYLVD